MYEMVSKQVLDCSLVTTLASVLCGMVFLGSEGILVQDAYQEWIG